MMAWIRRMACSLGGHVFSKSVTTYEEGAMFARCVSTCSRCGEEWLQLRYPPGNAQNEALNRQLEFNARFGYPQHHLGGHPNNRGLLGLGLF